MIKVIFRYLYLFVDMLSFGWNSPYFFFSLFVVSHKNISWSQRLFLNFFVHERESKQRDGDNELQSSKERRKTWGTRVTKVLNQKVSIYSKWRRINKIISISLSPLFQRGDIKTSKAINRINKEQTLYTCVHSSSELCKGTKWPRIQLGLFCSPTAQLTSK